MTDSSPQPPKRDPRSDETEFGTTDPIRVAASFAQDPARWDLRYRQLTTEKLRARAIAANRAQS